MFQMLKSSLSEHNGSIIPYQPWLVLLFGPRREKTCLRGLASNTGADQPAYTRSLISAFVVRVLEGSISVLASGKFQFSS